MAELYADYGYLHPVRIKNQEWKPLKVLERMCGVSFPQTFNISWLGC
jgi:hypothetical protein